MGKTVVLLGALAYNNTMFQMINFGREEEISKWMIQKSLMIKSSRMTVDMGVCSFQIVNLSCHASPARGSALLLRAGTL